MTDETPPKRRRGLKDQEAAYRAGFQDGRDYAEAEQRDERDLISRREKAMGEGFKRLREQPTSPTRTRRKKTSGVDYDAIAARDAAER